MKKNLTLLSLFLCCILCCSCGKEKEPQNKPTKTENYSQVYANRMQITEEGNLTLLSLFLCCILCCSCGKEKEPQNKPTKTENYSQVYANRMQITEEGIYYIDGYTKLMKFYDFALKDSIPLCDKPNCKHKNIKCNAYLENGFQSAMGCYRGKLYYFDMNKPTLPLYQCDKNGKNPLSM